MIQTNEVVSKWGVGPSKNNVVTRTETPDFHDATKNAT